MVGQIDTSEGPSSELTSDGGISHPHLPIHDMSLYLRVCCHHCTCVSARVLYSMCLPGLLSASVYVGRISWPRGPLRPPPP